MTPRDRMLFIEPDGSNREEVRRLGYRFIDLLVDAASEASHHIPVPEEFGGRDPIRSPYEPSAAGRSADELLATVRERVLDRVLNPAHPGYVGHMDSLASTVGIFSDAIVSACNNNMLSYEMSLAFTRMERTMMEWAARRFGLGGRASGYLVSGGTLANIQAVWSARNAILADAADRGLAGVAAQPVVLASENAHYSFLKAANLLGLGRSGLLRVAPRADGRVRAADFDDAIAAAIRSGLRPFCLVGIAGTTVTGQIEPLAEMAAVARRHGLWFHVDAAYGGSLVLSEHNRARLAGIETADSITWNPQKWLYVPKTCASLLYRDGAVVDATVRERFVYGRDEESGERPNLGEFTIQGTRRVDVLKLWLTLEHFGTAYLAELIDSHLDRARRLAERIRESEELELIAEPDLSIVCFRARPPGIDPNDGAAMDAIQARVQREVAKRSHGWLSMPLHRGRRVLRAVILHPRCDDAVLDSLLMDVREAARRL